MEYKSVPCFIEEDWDEEKQKLKTVRNNLVKGDLNPVKFTKLVRELEPRFDPHVLPELFGFDSAKEMYKYVVEEKDKKEKSFLDGLLEESRKEKYATDSLTEILADIFSQTAETIDQNYLFFTHKGRMHMAIICDNDTFKEVKNMVSHLNDTGEYASDFIRDAIKAKLGQMI